DTNRSKAPNSPPSATTPRKTNSPGSRTVATKSGSAARASSRRCTSAYACWTLGKASTRSKPPSSRRTSPGGRRQASRGPTVRARLSSCSALFLIADISNPRKFHLELLDQVGQERALAQQVLRQKVAGAVVAREGLLQRLLDDLPPLGQGAAGD